jgi:hypothetical protein
MANPLSAPIRGARLDAPAGRRGSSLASWLIVPIALVIGIGLGALAFFLSSR